MTRVDFYLLPEAVADPLPTAVRLCDKACHAGHRLYAHAPCDEIADALDRALWSLRQGSFISHERYLGQAPEPPPPAVLIGGAEPPPEYQDLLLNLDAEVPAFFSRFPRVLEIVAGDAQARDAARRRYKFYRDRGYPLVSHKL